MIKSRSLKLVVPLLIGQFVASEAGYAQFATGAYVRFNGNAEGECVLQLEQSAPWSAINSECGLRELEGAAIKRSATPIVLAGYNLGNPVRSQAVWTWVRFLVGAHSGEEYCANFGIYDTGFNCPDVDFHVVTFGHYQDPNQTPTVCGSHTCRTVLRSSPRDRKSPLLLDLDGNRFHLSGGPVYFDMNGDAQLERLAWVSPGTMDALLYLDRNGNGIVDNGLELFGDSTILMDFDLADHGYEALAEFDLLENGGTGDGVIDALDSVFADLRVWLDSNGDAVCHPSETMSLFEAGVVSLKLDYRESRRTDAFGNEVRYVSEGEILVKGKSKKMWTADVFFLEID